MNKLWTNIWIATDLRCNDCNAIWFVTRWTEPLKIFNISLPLGTLGFLSLSRLWLDKPCKHWFSVWLLTSIWALWQWRSLELENVLPPNSINLKSVLRVYLIGHNLCNLCWWTTKAYVDWRTSLWHIFTVDICGQEFFPGFYWLLLVEAYRKKLI